MVIAYGFTDKGILREINEDNWYAHRLDSEKDVYYAMVADGMGGHNAGDVASALAVTCISDYINSRYSDGLSYGELKALIISAVEAANAAIYQESIQDPAKAGMGTTLTMCFFWDGSVIITHIGDSRLYIMRKNALHKITRDHSLVAELVAQGKITEEEALTHPKRNIITRALGTDEKADIDVCELKASDGDIFLICTDGLYSMVPAESFGRTMLTEPNMDDIPKKLIDAANAAGGADNITVVCLKYRENGKPKGMTDHAK